MEKLPFIPSQVYRRSDIHDQFGGNRQSGISPSANFPYIFIFSGKQGKEHGYQDAWDNPHVYSYTGEGQDGDMQFIKGNLALRDHLQNGKRVFLFEYVQRGYVKFVSELEVFDVDFFETLDTKGKSRKGIKFFFTRVGDSIPKLFSKFKESTIVAEASLSNNYVLPTVTERRGLVTSRVGQGAYRKRIIHRWEYQCAVTGFNKPEILIASHIVPWVHSTDQERLDINNGILLSPVYDALFDRHLITFENNGKILLSDRIDMEAYLKIGLKGNEKIKKLSQENCNYLERHRVTFNNVKV